MSRQKSHKAIFERKLPKQDHFSSEGDTWGEICREYVSLEPLNLREQFYAHQTESLASHKAEASWSPTMATVTPASRMKTPKPVPVDLDNPEAEENYRIFHIESIINVLEKNQELELMVVEQL